MLLAKYFVTFQLVGGRIIWFLAAFGDLGWGKAEGRWQRAEGGRRKKRYN
jgi:hypothetical protein